jgi:hypothetical protein
MKRTRLSRTLTCGAAPGLTLLTMSLFAGASPASAQDDRAGPASSAT